MSPRSWVAAATLALAAVAPASAGWLPVGGPTSPQIALRFDPARPELLYARVISTDQGLGFLWRSQDRGATWRNIQKGLEIPSDALAIDPENPKVIWVWAGGETWRSGDAGDTWARRSVALPDESFDLSVLDLLVDPHHPSTLYRVSFHSAGNGGSVDVSFDGGASFQQGGPLPIATPVVQMGHDELLAFDFNGLEVSKDGGQTWQVRGRYHRGFSGGSIAPSSSGTIYGLGDPCLARSDDGGAHWRRLPYPRLSVPTFGCSQVVIDPKDARHLWVGGEPISFAPAIVFQLSESRDGGETWAGPLPLPKEESSLDVLATGGDHLAMGRYLSTDGGRTWTRRNRQIATGDARFGLVAQDLPGRGGLRLVALDTPLDSNPDGLFRSHGGKSWNRIPLPDVSFSVTDAGAPTLVAASSGSIIRSRDSGDTWSGVPGSPPQAITVRSDLVQPRFLTVDVHEDNGEDGNLAVWTSDDAGATWRRTSGLLQDCRSFLGSSLCQGYTAYAVDPFDSSRRWIANQANFDISPLLFVSSDAGASWQVLTEDLPGILAIATDPKTKGRLLAGTYEGLLETEDYGEHWHSLGSGLPAGEGIRHLARDSRSATLYAATHTRGIYRSADGGANWALLPGAPDLQVPSIAIDPRTPGALFAAFRGQGVWLWTP